MEKDKQGFIWLGTPSGLVRFDGYDFEVYSPDNSDNKRLKFAGAGNIFIDSQERIWLGSWGQGIAVYDANLNLLHHFTQDLNQPNSIQSGMIQTFFEDHDKNIWVGTNGGGLAQYLPETNNFKNYIHNPKISTSISHNRIWSIAQSQDGAIWVATNEGLNRLKDKDTGEFERFTHEADNPNSIDHPLVRAILVDSSHNLWLGTEISFGKFTPETNTYVAKHPRNSAVTTAITRIREGNQNDLWVGTQKGVFRFEVNADRFTELVTESKYAIMPHDDIRDIYISDDNSIWISTRFAGLSHVEFSQRQFTAYQQYTDINGATQPFNMVYCFLEDDTGKIWLGTSGGIMLWQGDKITTPKIENLPALSDIYTLTFDQHQNIWVGSQHGLGYIDLITNRYTARNDILSTPDRLTVTDIHIDSDNYLWVATNHGGLVRYQDGNSTRFQSAVNDANSISSNSISTIKEDDKGRLWLGAYGRGVNRLDPNRTKFFRYRLSEEKRKESLSGITNDIFQSSDFSMWFGTDRGLNKLDDVTDMFEHFSIENGLANSSIKSIEEDADGNIWVSTEFGLSQFKRDQLFFVNYQKHDGLHSNNFFQRASMNSPTRGILFAGQGGFTQIKQVTSSFNPRQPKPYITGAWVDGKKLNRYAFDTLEGLNLVHTTKNIRLKFSALNFTDAEDNQYRYRLINEDDTWSKPSKENEVTFSGLDFGQYQFQLLASNNNNVWAEHPITLNITIATPWWRLWWLQAIAGMTILLLIYLWYKQRTRALASHKVRLEREVSSRTEELFTAQKQLIESEKNASLSGLVAGVAHEINTPVGISVTAASNLMNRSNALKSAFQNNALKRSEFEAHINNIHESAEMVLSNLSRAADLIHSFKEVSVDQISQQKRHFNFEAYLHEIIASLMPRLKKEHVTVALECPTDIDIDNYPGAIAQLITNLAINTVVHAFDNGKGGEISIKAWQQADYLYIDFSDNGKGIPKQHLDKIFEPFYTTKRGQGGSGLGLQIISNIVNIRLGGQIHCTSEEGVGTTFHIKILANPE